MSKYHSDPDNWALAILTDASSDQAVRSVLRAIWASPLLEGPYAAKPDRKAKRLDVDDVILGSAFYPQWGRAEALPGVSVAVVVTTFLHGRGRSGEDGVGDHVYLEIPLPDLDRLWPVASLLDRESPDPPDPRLDDWFIQVARAAAVSPHFRRAIVGRGAIYDTDFLCGERWRNSSEWWITLMAAGADGATLQARVAPQTTSGS
jgi:hypothetical protein